MAEFLTGEVVKGELKGTIDTMSNFWTLKYAASDELIEWFIVCQHCDQIFLSATSTGSSSLNKHAETRCKKREAKGQMNLSSFVRPVVLGGRPPISPDLKSESCQMAAKCCAQDMRPMNIFSCPGMQEYCQFLNDVRAKKGQPGQ